MLTDETLRGSVGAANIREGFARTPRLDLWWACGFPELVLMEDVSPKKGAVAWWQARDGLNLLPGAWPAEVVHMVVRHAAESERIDRRGRSVAEIKAEREAAQERALARGPADAATGRRVLDRLFEADIVPGTRGLIYAVEAVLGTDGTVQHLLDRMEALPIEELARHAPYRGTLVLQLAPMLMRLSPGVHGPVHERLRALLDAASAVGSFGPWTRRPDPVIHKDICAALDLVLGGAEAAIAMQIRNPSQAVLTEDGPFLSGYFTGLTGAKWTSVAPRGAFAAPEAALVHYTRCWDEYSRKEQQLELVEALSTLADPRIVEWMFQMAQGSKVKAAARDWFVAHREETAEWVCAIRDDPKHPRRSGAATLAKKMKV